MPHSLLETDLDATLHSPPDYAGLLADAVAVLACGERLAVLLHPAAAPRAKFLDALALRLVAERFRVLRVARVGDTPFDLRSLMHQVIRDDGAEGTDPVAQFYAALTRPEADETRLVLMIDDADRLTDKTLGYLDLLASTAGLTPLPLQFLLAGTPALWGRLPETGPLARGKVALRVVLPGTDEPEPPSVTSPSVTSPSVTSEPAASDPVAPQVDPGAIEAGRVAPPAQPASGAALAVEPQEPFEPVWLREQGRKKRRSGSLLAATICGLFVLGAAGVYWYGDRIDGRWLDLVHGQPLRLKPPPAATPAQVALTAGETTPAPPPATAEPSLPPPRLPPVALSVPAPPQPAAVAPAPAPAAPAAAAVSPPAAPSASPEHGSSPPRAEALPPDVLKMLLGRGQTLLASGDVAAARQMFLRAAEANAAPAMVALGMTYDPRFLAQINAQGIKPDPDGAAFWYRRAADLGSPDAAALLGQLGDAHNR